MINKINNDTGSPAQLTVDYGHVGNPQAEVSLAVGKKEILKVNHTDI